VTIQDIAFSGVNGAISANYGVFADVPANFDTLTIDRSTFTGFVVNGVAVNGDTTTGISARNVAISNSTFTNNGSNDNGTGDIDLFTYNGDASFTNLTLSNNGANNARLGIQLRGVGSGSGVGVLPMGNVSFNGVTITGKYRTQFIGFQRYSTVTGLSLNNVTLGGATSEITGTFGSLMRFDAVGSGSVASPATVNLGNTYFRGVAPTSAQKTDLEFAPDNTFTFLRADATNTRWDTATGPGVNVAAGSLTVAQAFEVEDRIHDYVDFLTPTEPFKGWAELQNGHAFVTATDVIPAALDGRIQRAVDIVDPGGTVHIAGGSYTGNVNTTAKSVTLSPGAGTTAVTINGNLALDSNDTVVMEINGTTPGTQHDQFLINGTTTLGGATLDTSGSAIVATPGDTLTLINNDGTSDPVSGFFASPANGNGNAILVNGQPFFIFYNGGDGNDVTLTRAPNGTVVGPPAAPAVVFVDDNWSSFSNGQDTDTAGGGVLGNGTAKGIDEFDNIQDAINAVAVGGEIRIYAGTYVQTLIVGKSLKMFGQDFLQSTVAGDGSNDVIIDPTAVASHILEINASNVEVAGLTVEGDGTDAYGILATHPTDTLTGLSIHDNAVRNLTRRGIQTDTYLAQFNIYNNTVSNVVGDPEAIAIFNFGGGGSGAGLADIHDNVISGSTVAIGGQQSAGMHVYNNTITLVNGGTGIQDSNPGTGAPPPAGATETFINNTMSGGNTGSTGIAVINQAMDVLVKDNHVTTPGTGLGVFGSFSASTTTFDHNSVAIGLSGTGIRVTTDSLVNGPQDVVAVITNNNDISGGASGILVEDTDGAGTGKTATATISNNSSSIHDNFAGIDVSGGTATITNNHIHNNTNGIRVRNGGTATVSSNQFDSNGIGILADGGTAIVTNTQSVGAVAITNNGLVKLPAGSNAVLITTSLTINGGGQLDIADNAAIIDYSGSSPVQSVRGQLKSGRAGGAWSGPGIMSSVAAVTPNFAIGYADNANAFGTPRSTFAGQSVDATSILIHYTRYGDADLDGDTDGVDIGNWSINFTGELGGTGTKVWSQGDWDYDGDVDGVDSGLWAQAFTGELGGGGLGSPTATDPAPVVPTKPPVVKTPVTRAPVVSTPAIPAALPVEQSSITPTPVVSTAATAPVEPAPVASAPGVRSPATPAAKKVQFSSTPISQAVLG
jgi:hypothetical protein